MALFSDSENKRLDFLKVWTQNGTWVDIDLLCGSAAVQNNGVPTSASPDPDDASWDPSQRSKIAWKFNVYVDWIGAILEGIDEFEIAITGKTTVRTDYFTSEKSPESVSQDIKSYIKRFKESVQETDDKEEYIAKTFGITEFLDDNIVSDISSGVINKKNKNSKYPIMEVTYARKIKGRQARKYRKNYGNYPRRLLYTSESTQELARRVFNDTGTDPATLGFITYPSIPDEDLESGTTTRKDWRKHGRRLRAAVARYPVDESGESTISTTDLGANESSKMVPDSLYQLYNKFVRIDRARRFTYYDIRKKRVRVKFIPTTIVVEQIFEDSAKMLNLLKKRSIYVEVQWKSKGIVIQTERYRINPSAIVSRLAASANKYRAQNPTFVYFRPSRKRRDRVYVRNRGYRGARPEIEDGFVPWSKKTIQIFGTYPMFGNRDFINTKLISKELLRGNRRWTRRPNAMPFFGTRAYPRSYRISTTDSAGANNPLCNINWITTPKRLNIKPDVNETDHPAVLMIGTSPTLARVIIGGLPSTVTHIKFKVKKVGSLDADIEQSFGKDGKTTQYTRVVRKPRTRSYAYRTIGKTTPVEDGATYMITCQFYVHGTLQKDLAAEGIYTHYAGKNSIYTSAAAQRLSFGLSKAGGWYSPLWSAHRMTLNQTIASTAESDFLSQVNSAGQAELYSTELEETKTSTGLTISYRVERLNWNTGRVEIVLSDLSGEAVQAYIDEKSEPYPLSFAVKGDNALDRYTYTIKANVLESAALSYTTVVKEIDSTTGNEYLYRYRKWRNDEISEASGNYDKGVLPARGQILRDSMSEAVNKSVSGITSTATFQPSVVKPQLRYISAYADYQNGTNWITWRCRGDETLIDHFIITAEYNGFRAPIGVAAPIKSGRRYLYAENKMHGIYGEVEYKVYIVLKDLRYISSRRRAIVKRTTNMPSFAMVRKRRSRRRGK